MKKLIVALALMLSGTASAQLQRPLRIYPGSSSTPDPVSYKLRMTGAGVSCAPSGGFEVCTVSSGGLSGNPLAIGAVDGSQGNLSLNGSYSIMYGPVQTGEIAVGDTNIYIQGATTTHIDTTNLLLTPAIKFNSNATGLKSSSGSGLIYTDDATGSVLQYGSTQLSIGGPWVDINAGNGYRFLQNQFIGDNSGHDPGGISLNPTAFSLLGSPADGQTKYCSDCMTSNPCKSGGSGAFAHRVNGAWACADNPPLTFSVVDMGTTLGATAGSGSFTTGHSFQVTESGCSVTGVRFRWDGANHTIKASLFNSGGTNLQSATVTTTGAGVYTVTFASAQTPTAFTKYRVGMWENSGAQYEKFTSTPNGAPISATTPPSPVINWEGPRVMIYSFNEFGTGDAAPSTGLTTNGEWYPIEPILACP